MNNVTDLRPEQTGMTTQMDNEVPPLVYKSKNKTTIIFGTIAVLVIVVVSLAANAIFQRIEQSKNTEAETKTVSSIKEWVDDGQRSIEVFADEQSLYVDPSAKSDALQKLEQEALENATGSSVEGGFGRKIIQAVANDLGSNARQSAQPVASIQNQPVAKPVSKPNPYAGPSEAELLAMQLCTSLDGTGNTCRSSGQASAPAPTVVTSQNVNTQQPSISFSTDSDLDPMTQLALSQIQSGNPVNDQATIDNNQLWAEQHGGSQAEVSVAYSTGDRTYIVGEGKLIRVALKMAISSELAGDISGTVTNDIYADAGRRVLIPRGSLALGQYRSGASGGKSRIYAIWQKIRMPDGTEVIIDSNMTDDLGRSGVSGYVDRHFVERFAASAAMSFIGNIALNGSNSPDASNTSVTMREAVAAVVEDATKGELKRAANVQNTIFVSQGDTIQIYVNKDLDFSQVYSE